MQNIENKEFIEKFKSEWKSMWRNRVDDKVRAEGIADKEYSLLFVDRGTVIIATRKFKVLDFYDILQQHKPVVGNEIIPPYPSVGGWGKFIRGALVSGNLTRRGRLIPPKPNKRSTQLQLKKGGRGWLHFKR